VLVAGIVTACDEQVVVRQDTQVYRDGALSRRLDVRARNADGEIPTEPDWLARSVGLFLAEPPSWRVLEERPDGFLAEAVFARADDVPVSLAHETERGRVADRGQVRLVTEDLVVLTRRVYEERVGDPFGPSSLEAVLDTLTEVAARALGDELRREFGSRANAAPAVTFVRGEGRAVVAELLGIIKDHHGGPAAAERARLLSAALARRGIPRPEGLTGAREWLDSVGLLLDPVLSWSRERVAALLSTSEERVAGEELSFWPDGQRLDEILSTNTDEPLDPLVRDFREAADSLLEAMEGYYGGPAAGRFRLEARLELPGRLLRSNGTPVERGVLWVVDNEALSEGATMRVETAEVDDEALAALGARRDLGAVELLRLCDLLTDPEHGPRLLEGLAAAVREGSFAPLADEELVQQAGGDAGELLELLDPSLR